MSWVFPHCRPAAYLALALLAGAVGGCANFVVLDCAATDWEALGLADAESGAESSALPRYRSICARQGSEVDLVAYRTGVAEGLRRYCTAATGYALGVSNAPPLQRCPSDLAMAVDRAYWEGREVWRAQERETEALARDIRRTQQELDAVEIDLEQALARMREADIAWGRRAEWIASARALSRQRQALANALDELKDRLAATRSLVARSDGP